MRFSMRILLILSLVASMLVVSTGSAQLALPSVTTSNTAPIVINDSSAATPFPSTIVTSGLAGTVTGVTVTLTGYSHSCPNDVDVLLVGPTGAGVLLMSDIGTGLGCPAAVDATLTFDDAAATIVPYPPVTGTYLPTDEASTSDDFTLYGGPAGTFGTALSVFNGVDPNGTWSLYVVDQADSDTGQFAGGWSLSIIGVNDAFSQLLDDTIALVDNPTAEQALVTTVEKAQTAFNAGNTWGAYVAVLKYVMQVNAYARSRAISPAVAQQLMSEARAAYSVLF
jgi:subtilisin-like proprotein convertase family protein